MREYPVDEGIRSLWRLYPVRISAESRCDDCGAETFLVQSMKGGFVTRNCREEGHKNTLSEPEFLEIAKWMYVVCPECNKRMKSGKYENNYCFICDKCDGYYKLASLLPHWEDL